MNTTSNNLKKKKIELSDDDKNILRKTIELVISENALLKSAILLHPKQIPRAGVTGKMTIRVIDSVNLLEKVFRETFATEST